jgi:carbamoyl-phosphate synthase small subunit
VQKSGYLVLADGSVFRGSCLFEGTEIVAGELVFSTSTSGYVEVLTDPSYYGQIVVLANPEIGNYGVNHQDFQSDSIKVKALVVRNLSRCASSFRSEMTLADWLLREQVPLIYGLDTRALISHIRDNGVMNAVLASDHDVAALLKMARETSRDPHTRLSSFVCVDKPQVYDSYLLDINGRIIPPILAEKKRVVVLDFGVKLAILRYLSHFGCELTLVPGDATPEEIWQLQPDGLFLSNGPGDPQTEKIAVNTTRALLGKLPIFGVCLGHQILGQALGLSTYKLKFGHRGSNQAVRSESGIITTAQNHGYAISDPSALTNVSEDINISDGTNEGLDLPHLFVFSVQFHPEGAPGPHDSLIYFEKFMSYMAQWKKLRNTGGYLSAHSQEAAALE